MRKPINLAEGQARPKKFSRARRPGQAPPDPRGGSRHRESANDELPNNSSSYFSEDDEDVIKIPRRTYMLDMKRQAEEFDNRRAANLDEFTKAAPWAAKLRDKFDKMLAAGIQDHVDEVAEDAVQRHPCCASRFLDASDPPVYQTARRAVQFIDHGFRTTVSVPSYLCRTCDKKIEVHPYMVDCAPTTPTEHCLTWISQSFLLTFRDVHLNNGLSANAWLRARENEERRLQPGGITILNSRDDEISGGLKPQQLVTAMVELGKVEILAKKDLIEQLPDPYAHCLVCAMTHRPYLSNGTPVLNAKTCASMDAINSANHFTSAGSSQQSNKPTLRMFVSALADKVSLLHASGEMVSEAQNRRAAADALEPDGDSTVLPRCTTELSCNRPTVKAGRAETDICGLVAACCPHVFPLLGTAIPMVTPENHTYYEYLLESLIQSRPDLELVFLDLACRFRGRWMLLLDRLRDRVAGVDDIRLMLPMMHAFDHDMACQLKNSALYQEGAARRVGEQTEELWSEIKKFCKVARYMTHANWRDCMDMLFLLLSSRKQWNFPKMLEARTLRIAAKIGTCTTEKKKIEDDARSQGVTDLEAAMRDLDSDEIASHADLSLGAQWLVVQMKLASLDNLNSHRAAMDVLLPDNIGANVERRSGSDVRERLANARDNLEVKLTALGKMLVGQPWEVESQEYADAQVEVKAYMVQHYQGLTEDQVFKDSQLKQEMGRLESGKNGHQLKKRMAAIKANVKGLLWKWKRWQVFPGGAEPSLVTDAELKATMHQDFIWGSAALAGNGTASARRHFGMRYRTAINQLARTKEEATLLKVETVRVFNWLEEREGAARGAIAAAEEEAARCADGLEAIDLSCSAAFELKEQRRLAAGKVVLLRREDERLQCIHRDAYNRLQRFLPPPPG